MFILQPNVSRWSHIFLTLGFLALASRATGADAFHYEGLLINGRNSHSATVMADGKVLIAGGNSSSGSPVSKVEIHDPITRTSVSTGSLLTARAGHKAVLLSNNKILVAGGASTAELFDPAAGIWSDVTPADGPLTADSLTLLASGKVLVIGGNAADPNQGKARLFDPASNAWSITGSLPTNHKRRSATRLKDGRVLVAGGTDGGTGTTLTEIYDPSDGTWGPTGALNLERSSPVSVLLNDGRVLAIGSSSGSSSTAETYDPATGTWANNGSLVVERQGFSTVVLPNGTVLVTGGFQDTSPLIKILSSSEIHDPATGLWKKVDSLDTLRCLHQSCILQDGSVLITGGWGYNNPEVFGDYNHEIRVSEIYLPVAESWTKGPDMDVARAEHFSTRLANGKVIVLGGSGKVLDEYHPYGQLDSAEIFDPATGVWQPATSRSYPYTGPTVPMKDGRIFKLSGSQLEIYSPKSNSWTLGAPVDRSDYDIVGTLLQSGKVLISGFVDGSVRIYDPVNKSWSQPSGTSGPRARHSACRLPDGRVLAVGGYYYPRTCTIFDPVSSNWTSTGSLTGDRSFHTSVLMASGRVLLCGGRGTNNFPLTSAEIYDPASGTWRPTHDSMSKCRISPILNILPDRRILAIGGGDPETSNTAEIYDEVTDSWQPTAPLGEASSRLSACLLASGKVLVTGGYSEDGYSARTELFTPTVSEILISQPSNVPLANGAARNFGILAPGESTSLLFTLRNTGNSALSGISLQGLGTHPGEFAIGSPGANFLVPGASTTFPVTFHPGSEGLKKAVVRISSNDEPFDILLTGKAAARSPEIVVKQPSTKNLKDGRSTINFGSVAVLGGVRTKTFTVKNTGTARLSGIRFTGTGTGKNSFKISKLRKSALAPGSIMRFRVTFNPVARGRIKAAIRIRSNDGDENPFDIKLKGRGK